ncbi:hypothetical protein NDU88_000946 [Pleurodeles waltl]|uniref:Uncharacterized protein n=1 Tax=Pleurodeles waltl TaxID=8319 RepID=A0AAV7NIP9_PLEWA|nr:hypothetical protein NDU88_000946 [Pleurodeles waltl]
MSPEARLQAPDRPEQTARAASSPTAAPVERRAPHSGLFSRDRVLAPQTACGQHKFPSKLPQRPRSRPPHTVRA